MKSAGMCETVSRGDVVPLEGEEDRYRSKWS